MPEVIFEVNRDLSVSMRDQVVPGHNRWFPDIPPGATIRSGRRSPSGPLTGASRHDRGRIDRARTGEPVVTGPPTGCRRPTSHVH